MKHLAMVESVVEELAAVSKPPAEEQESDVSLFDLLPEMIPKFRRMTIGGKPVFDSSGKVIPPNEVGTKELTRRSNDDEVTTVNIQAWKRRRK